MGRFDSLRELGSLWYQKQKRRLQGTPETLVDSGGNGISYSFNEQAHSRSALREIKEMREDGGVVSTLVHTKALMTFGGGVELDTENEDLEAWVDEELPDLDQLVLEMGEDALWYPYTLAETVPTQGGGFSHIEPIEPWTMQPETDAVGEIQYWEQEINRHSERFGADEIGAIILNKSCARDKTGISDVLKAKSEIQHYREIEEMVQKSAEVAAVPHNHWIVGREGGAPLNDNDLRRVRTLVERLEGDTQIITGPDVEHDRISADDYDFESLIAHKLRQMAIALGVPLEMVASGDHGLGAGSESEARMRVFETESAALRRKFATQFESEFLRPILNEYSPYNVNASDLDFKLSNPIEQDDREAKLNHIAEDMTVNERRKAFDLEPIEDEELGSSYDTARGETTEQEDMGGGGLFGSDGGTDFRGLAVPDNAVSIDDPSEAPPDAQIVRGDRGGLYYVPAGEAPGDADADGPSEQVDPEEVANNDLIEDFAGNSMVPFEDMTNPTDAEPGVPIVSETPRGEMEAGVLIEIREEASGPVAVYEQADGEVMFAGPGESRDIVGVADRDSMGDEELHQYAQNRIQVGPEFEDMPSETEDRVVSTLQNGVLTNVQDGELAADLAERTNQLRDEVDRAYHAADGDGFEMAFRENDSESTVHHEMGHNVHAVLGYMGEQGIQSVAHENSRGDVPDFEEEYKFGEDVPEFNQFLLSDEDGNTPGEREAIIERAVANADKSDFETQSVSDTEEGRVEDIQDLDRGDLAVIAPGGEEVVGRFVEREDAFVGDELYQFEVLVDEDGNTPETRRFDGVKTDTDIRDNPEFRMSDDFVGKVDKEATAQNTDYNIPQPAGGGGERSAEEEFFAQVNRSWAESAAHSEAGRGYVAESTSIKDGYSVNNTHETTARAVEALQNGDENAIEDMAENQPEMLGALLEMMDAPDGLDDLLAELGF